MIPLRMSKDPNWSLLYVCSPHVESRPQPRTPLYLQITLLKFFAGHKTTVALQMLTVSCPWE